MSKSEPTQVAGRKKSDSSALRDQISQRVDNLRGEIGISQAELSRRSALDPTTISKMVRGEYTFADYHLEQLAEALEVSPAQLLPDGPNPNEVAVLEAIRAGEPGPALHALAVALGITGRALVAAAGFGASTSNEARPDRAMAAVGWAAATLTRQIAEAVSVIPNGSVDLAAFWMSWGGPPDRPDPPDPPDPPGSPPKDPLDMSRIRRMRRARARLQREITRQTKGMHANPSRPEDRPALVDDEE